MDNIERNKILMTLKNEQEKLKSTESHHINRLVGGAKENPYLKDVVHEISQNNNKREDIKQNEIRQIKRLIDYINENLENDDLDDTTRIHALNELKNLEKRLKILHK